MNLLVILIFIFGYFAITIEHVIKVDKLVPALITMTLLWAIIALGIDDVWFLRSVLIFLFFWIGFKIVSRKEIPLISKVNNYNFSFQDIFDLLIREHPNHKAPLSSKHL